VAAMRHDLLRDVSADRLRDLTLDLVRIPSPTGDSRAVTDRYVREIEALGLGVQVLNTLPSSPSTIARLVGDADGPTLTLDGHLDTIHAAHPEPYATADRIYGRGAGDMKSGIAAMVEALRVLVESDVQLGGTLILATHSLHEAPVGHMEGLRELIARGDVFVDAAIVAESGFDTLPLRGKGQALYEIVIRRAGEVLHENVARPRGIPNPLDAAAALAGRILTKTERLASADDALLGPETLFLGQIHGGDFYNRVPVDAMLNGTYRCWPDKDWTAVEDLFAGLLAGLDRDGELEVDVRLLSNGLGYAVDPDAPIVGSLRRAYERVVGQALPFAGAQSVCDVNLIVREAGIPAVPHGTGSTTAHADLEWVDLVGVVRATRVYLAAIADYLGI